MAAALLAAQYLTAIAFGLLGVASLVDFMRTREPANGWLALAIGMLAATAVLGRLQPLLTGAPARVMADVSLVALLASGYGLLRLRASFIPLSRRLRIGAEVGLVLVAAIAVLAQLPTSPDVRPTAFQSLVIALVVFAWAACVGEPIVRFWLAARGRPAVQRARLRSLSAGFAMIVAILVVAVIAPTALTSMGAKLVVQLLVLGIVPLLFFSFWPPAIVRREWRASEESALRAAIQDLLLYSRSRNELARRALEWALRLVGADAGAVVEESGELLANNGMEPAQARELMARVDAQTQSQVVSLRGQRQAAIVVRLPLAGGPGALIVVSGPFTPVFGTDELKRVVQYSTAITAGLDRAIVTERLSALEETKTHFLNLASHELRGPLTVIRGYLSMMEKGSLGEINEKVSRVLPLLVGKAEEMNLLIEQMLEAARLEEGRLELRPQRRDLRELVEHTVEMMRPLAGDKHSIRLEEPETAVPVTVDPDRIGTILANLIDNAFKYSPGGGEVACRVTVSNGVSQVAVIDRGVGIDAADMPRLFTRFGRVVTRETAHIGGTGLGLYLSRELARLHRGDITVESEPGAGSTFVLSVPSDPA